MKNSKNIFSWKFFTGLILFFFSLPAYADFKLGYEAFLNRDYANAAKLLSTSHPAKGDLLTDYHLWALGRSLIENGDWASGRKKLEALLRIEPQSLFANAAHVQIGRSLQAEGQNDAAKKYLGPLLPNLSEDLKGEALYYLALAEISSGEKESGLSHLRQVYFEFPSTLAEQIPALWQKASGIPFPAGSPTEQMTRADRLFANQAYTKALDIYTGLSSVSDLTVRELAQVRRGECLYALKRYSEATAFLIPGPSLDASIARTALVHLGMSQLRSGNEPGSILTLTEVQRRFPNTAEGEESLYRLGMIAFQAGHLDEALQAFKKLTDAYPQGNFRDKGIWAAAWAAYRNGDFTSSAGWLKALEQGATDPGTLGKALYWQARIAELQKQPEIAKKNYELAAKKSPYSYYGFLSLKKLAGSNALSETPKIPIEWKLGNPSIGNITPHSLNAIAWRHFRKAEKLAEQGLGRLSLPELEFALQASTQSETLAQLLEGGRKTSASFIGVLFGQKYWNRFKVVFPNEVIAEKYRIRLQYPFAYRHEIEKAGHSYGVEPTLIVGLMRQESSFMPWISSGSNAQGLMQLLPTTASARAKAAGLSNGNLFDPAYNIAVGSAELKTLLQRFSNNWPLVLAAYNAGPRNAKKWNDQFGNLAIDEWIEEIPFAETNLYVKLVLRNHWIYKTLYP